jgi:hypothetical protein
MSPRSKREYLETIYLRYKRTSLKKKTIILNEFCQNCNYHRKHAIRLLNNYNKPNNTIEPKSKGRPSVYNHPKLIEPLKRIWLTANLPCSKRLKSYPRYMASVVYPGIRRIRTWYS